MPSLPGPPMTLGNMRSLGVRSLALICELCHHKAVLPADRWSDAVFVRAFRPRIVHRFRYRRRRRQTELAGDAGERELERPTSSLKAEGRP